MLTGLTKSTDHPCITMMVSTIVHTVAMNTDPIMMVVEGLAGAGNWVAVH